MKTKTKSFDCIEMKRKAALRIHEAVKDMTVEQEVAFWRKQNEDFHRPQTERISPGPNP